MQEQSFTRVLKLQPGHLSGELGRKICSTHSTCREMWASSSALWSTEWALGKKMFRGAGCAGKGMNSYEAFEMLVTATVTVS